MGYFIVNLSTRFGLQHVSNLADEHTRVSLQQATASLAKKGRRALLGREDDGAELDANYVDGIDRPRAYIATAVRPPNNLFVSMFLIFLS